MIKPKLASQPPKPYPSGEIPQYGDVVRLTANFVTHLSNDLQARLEGRTGYIRGFSYGVSLPVVMFDAVGRRKPFELGNVESVNLEFVSRKGGSKDPQFTQGPWKAIHLERQHYICPQQGDVPICLMTDSTQRTPEQNAANCALVLDAPMFHEALRDLVGSLAGDDKASLGDALAKAKTLLDKHP